MSDLFGNHIVGFPTRWLICDLRILPNWGTGWLTSSRVGGLRLETYSRFVLTEPKTLYEPRCEKTSLWGFRPGPT